MGGAMTRDTTGVVVFRTSHDDRTKDDVNEQLIIVYEDDDNLVQSISRMVKWSVREERRVVGSEFLNEGSTGWCDYARRSVITVNPLGPFAYATFYCVDPWMPYNGGGKRYARMQEVFGTWDEALNWCTNSQSKAHRESLRSAFTRKEALSKFYEIQKIPILGARNGQAKAAMFRNEEPVAGEYETCRIVAGQPIIEKRI